MHAQLEALVSEMEEALAMLRRIGQAAPAVWSRRPRGGGWSAAECVAHLNLTSEAFIPGIEAGLTEAWKIGGGMPKRLRRDPIGWLLWKSVGPGGRVRMKTSASFVPQAGAEKTVIVAEFERMQAQIIGLARAADGFPIQRVRLASPFDARVKYSLFSALTILPAHQKRHLLQADRALSAA